MYKWLVAIGIILSWSTAHASECQVSLPERGELPDSVQKSPAGFLWVGTVKIAAQIPQDGHWTGMGPEHNYRDKWWWWREGYRAKEETKPELTISASRLDGLAPPVFIPHATNAYGPGWDRMLVGMEFPTSGCWEVVGEYHGHDLRFVFWVGSSADELNQRRVVLKVRAAIDAPDARFSQASTIIAEIGEGYQKQIELKNYKLQLSVLDKRDQEFSIRLDLLNPHGAVIDSRTLLATETQPAVFELSSVQVTSTGELQIRELISQRRDE